MRAFKPCAPNAPSMTLEAPKRVPIVQKGIATFRTWEVRLGYDEMRWGSLMELWMKLSWIAEFSGVSMVCARRDGTCHDFIELFRIYGRAVVSRKGTKTEPSILRILNSSSWMASESKCTVRVYIIQPLLLLECRSEMLRRTRCPFTVRKLSTSHSYHTLRSSVWRQKLTSTSDLAGNCMGIYIEC
jgi:hypothetical protein